MNEEEFIRAGREWLKEDRLRRMEEHDISSSQNRIRCKDRDRAKNILRSKKYRETHVEQMREYVDKNREAINKWKADYKRTDKGKASAQRYKANRRSRKRSSPNTLTFNEWLEILREYNYRCAYCGIAFDGKNRPERDHVIPVSKGGGNTKDNIVPSCRLCNAKKGDRIL